jgi:AraC-like DNA-binding protein
MNPSEAFNKLSRAPPSFGAGPFTTAQAFLERLRVLVAERFQRLTGHVAVAGLLDPLGEETSAGPPLIGEHPTCGDTRDNPYCRSSWQAHLARLTVQPEGHWHRCERDKLCAVVPVMWRRHCLAACRLVCPASIPEEMFVHHAELLEVLIENFLARHAEHLLLLPRLRGFRIMPDESAIPAEGGMPASSLHPQVRAALAYIDKHLSNTKMSAAEIADDLGLNPTYLAHLFAEQIGGRMSRYITARRVELAESLLAGTNWQIKRVARESGYTNPDWFSHVFHAYTGLPPGEYRRRIRSQQSSPNG